jgi:hypothetical protein
MMDKHPIELLDLTMRRKLETDLRASIDQPGLSDYPVDTLQEYVLLILKNKKSQKQIAEDLSEFMGSHATAFVGWCEYVEIYCYLLFLLVLLSVRPYLLVYYPALADA